ncbi:DUF761 domain-containing protein [Quillaja saponaria]|uniref:DUF761 domain-containing protein n=1 Tax=Quillaja saponaria TaxID=32244 RepID=A0AAD7PHY9_QUISA|nr:DUF761 domain-containing protein [Quillaja saponaria]
MMGIQNRSNFLSRLRRAVEKVRLLLAFNIMGHNWRIASMLRRGSLSKRQLSFNDRPGLRLCTEESDTEDSDSGLDSSSHGGLQRTTSYPSEDDIDKRAEMFIANFRRQLQMERQISLELRYCRGNSFELISP